MKQEATSSPHPKETPLSCPEEALQEIWFSSAAADDLHRHNAEEGYHRFALRTDIRKRNVVRQRIRRIGIEAAAVAVVLLVVAYASFRQGSNLVKSRFADITIEAPWGSRTRTVLPDGTVVWLNAGTRLTYSQGFGVNNRRVTLAGEGYFEVTHRAEQPFDVHTDELSVEVLGTKFNFRNYADDDEVTVSLIEGKIKVDNHLAQNDAAILLPDERALLNKKSRRMKLTRVNARNNAEWVNGNLFFVEVLLPDIVHELERSYDVHITIADSTLHELRFYAQFIRKEQPIGEVMKLLSSTGKLTYRIDGKQITLNASPR
jgi:ferric-dicitrate binding protein FerR (iron transport regulator)